MNTPNQTITSDTKEKLFFTIHLGSPNDKPRLDEHDRVTAIHKITQKFDTFSITEGRVCWQGQLEDLLLIHIATNRVQAVAEVAHALRSAFNQDIVAIQFGTHMIPATRNNNTIDTELTIHRLQHSNN